MVDILANIGFWGIFVWLIWLPIILIVTLSTPNKLFKKYFKKPHFNDGELVAFGSFPGFFMRTALFCRLYITPKAVKGISLHGFVEDSPVWFKVATVISSLGLVFHGAICFGV